MKTQLLACAAALLLASSAAVAAPADDSLGVGMKAPALTDVNWLKGDKVANWEPGQVYILDFWATWCGPCKKSIPHVNEVAKAHRKDGVTVIGVAIWPNSRMVPTKDFVAEKGDEMDYLIAEDIEGKTAKAFMTAARCNGIPTMMVIDRKGEIAWIGHPMAMDEPLAQILAGTDDRAALAAADAERRALVDAEQKLSNAVEHFDTLDAAAAAEALKLVDAQLAEDPANPQLAFNRYLILTRVGPKEEAAAYGKQLVDGALKDIPMGLNLLAWNIVDPKRSTARADRDVELALVAAARADELTKHEDANVLDTLARAHFLKGDVAKAVELQKLAIEKAAAEQKPGLEPSLAEYEAAAKSGG